MSWRHSSNIGFSAGDYFTYGGDGQFVGRENPSAEFIRRLKLPQATPVLLATIHAGWRLTAGRPNAPYGLGVFPIPDFPIAGVFVNGGSESLPTPPTEPSGFHPPEQYLYGYWEIPPGGPDLGGGSSYDSTARQVRLYYEADITTNANDYVALLAVRAATVPKNIRDARWPGRLVSAPNLSLRIEPRFGGPISQVGGGRLTLNNADGFYDWLEGAAWDAGLVTLEYGLDLPDSAMDEADYQPIGQWRVRRAERSDTQMNLELAELKARVEAEIPFEVLSRADYPALSNDDIGEPIPFAYGHVFAAPALCIDRAARQFKVCLHRIKSFDAVRIKKPLKSAEDETITGAWSVASGAAVVTNFEADVLNVLFGATQLTQKNSLAEVAATASTWYHEGSLLYVRPPGSQLITEAAVTVRKEFTNDAWVDSSFATTDLTNGEFTLGSDWDRSAEVSVDFRGRVKADTELMENWADIVADLLDYLGESRFDEQSFARSRRTLTIGADNFGLEVVKAAPSLLIKDKTGAREILAQICEACSASLFVDHAGAWRFNVFRPEPSVNLANTEANTPRTFTHLELLDPLVCIDDSKDVFSQVHVRFARRHAEDWADEITESRRLNKSLHSINEVATEEREPLLWRTEDARAYAQRLLTTEGPPLKTWSCTLPRHALFLLPADQIRLTHTRHGFTLALDATIDGLDGLDGIFEVLSVEKDFVGGRVRCVLGDRRGWGDTFGWWLIEDVTTPTMPNDFWTSLRAEGLNYNDGERVAAWLSEPGGISAYQSDPGDSRPVFRANQLNGLPALYFPGILGFGGSYGLNWLGGGNFPTTAGEIFVLVKAAADPGVAGYNSLWDFGTADHEYPAGDGTIKETFGLATRISTAVNPTPALTDWRLYNVSVKAGEFKIRLDGTEIYSSAAPSVGFSAGAVLGFGGGTALFTGYIAEVRSYPRVLASGERSAVQNYFATRTGLAIGTPGNTPLQWNRAWTNAQASYARKNYGFWHDDVWHVANLAAADNDPRAFETSRHW